MYVQIIDRSQGKFDDILLVEDTGVKRLSYMTRISASSFHQLKAKL